MALLERLPQFTTPSLRGGGRRTQHPLIPASDSGVSGQVDPQRVCSVWRTPRFDSLDSLSERLGLGAAAGDSTHTKNTVRRSATPGRTPAAGRAGGPSRMGAGPIGPGDIEPAIRSGAICYTLSMCSNGGVPGAA